ncbi:MAG: 16S rRNA (adenine(1518)-N(6)/adenine(1519)-N(6))-dimethyltransferase RsmA [Bryobacteraceae bacterium]
MPRRLGQHFLIRDSILERLAAAACGDRTPSAVEIGPGRGALTRHLLPRTDELHVIEIDAVLADNLRRKFADEPKLHVHTADVLATDWTQWGAAAIAGNLPYYIASPILERFLALDERFPLAVFLVQAEVAARLAAQPNTRDYGYLTVATRLVADVEIVVKAPPSAFSPPPKVDSAGVRLLRKPQPPLNLPELLKFTARCFAQKRKTLRNNLRPFYGEAADHIPEAGLRAEQLTIDQLTQLYARLTAGTC